METEYIKLHIDAKKCMRVTGIIKALILSGGLMALDFLVIFDASKTFFWIILAVAVLLALLVIGLVPKVRYERYRYLINDSVIRVREGFLWISETLVPMERLHKIQVSQGPIDRIFGLSGVRVTTAGGDCAIKFLKAEEANQIAEALKQKINSIALAERSRTETSLEEMAKAERSE